MITCLSLSNMIIINQMGLHIKDNLVNCIHIFEYLEY